MNLTNVLFPTPLDPTSATSQSLSSVFSSRVPSSRNSLLARRDVIKASRSRLGTGRICKKTCSLKKSQFIHLLLVVFALHSCFNLDFTYCWQLYLPKEIDTTFFVFIRRKKLCIQSKVFISFQKTHKLLFRKVKTKKLNVFFEQGSFYILWGSLNNHIGRVAADNAPRSQPQGRRGLLGCAASRFIYMSIHSCV